LFVGVITVSIIYVLFNMAIFYLVPANSISTTSLIAFDAARLVFGESGATFVVVLAIVSLLSILNAYMMIPPRILFGMSRDQYFIKQGMTVNNGGTPIVSLILSSAVSMILILVGSFESLFLLATLMSIVVIGVVFFAQIKLRETEPNVARPFRAWAYPITTYILIVISAALLIGFAYGDTMSFIITLGLTVLSYVVFFFVKKNNHF
jgi:basic amino acid/polyamine antiporter, APA family